MIKAITVVGPHLVDELFIELGIDPAEGRNGYVLEQFRKYEEEKSCALYVNGYNTGAQQQRQNAEPQNLDNVEYKVFIPDFGHILNPKP
jgi:hypothetical protein